MHSVDPTLPPLSWRGHLFAENRPLRVGWYDHDEVFPVTPGCRRAVTEARDALVAAGHTLVPFTPAGVRRAWRLLTACFTADQGQTSVRLLENEQLDQAVETNRQLMSAPRFVRAVVRQVVSRKSPLMADLLRSEWLSWWDEACMEWNAVEYTYVALTHGRREKHSECNHACFQTVFPYFLALAFQATRPPRTSSGASWERGRTTSTTSWRRGRPTSWTSCCAPPSPCRRPNPPTPPGSWVSFRTAFCR